MRKQNNSQIVSYRDVSRLTKSLYFMFIAAVLIVSGFLISTPVEAATLDVGPSQTYTTIQSAIDAAVDGDTINVATGTYDERLLITKDNLTIKAADGAQPIIQPTGSFSSVQRLIDIRGNGVTFSGFEVIGNGKSDIVNYDGSYLGIRIDGEGITVENNTIRDLLTGIQTTSKDIVSNVNNITGNTISNVAVGISLQNDGNYVTSNNITANSEGFGIASFNTHFENNQIQVTGSGVEAKVSYSTDGTYTGSIQDAINAVNSGDKVSVVAGIYSEQIVSRAECGNEPASICINKSLILHGESGTILNGAGLGNGSAIALSRNAYTNPSNLAISNVTIEGFEIKNYSNPGDTGGTGSGILAWNTQASNITIQNNYIHDVGWDGILVGSDTNAVQNNWIIKNNTFANIPEIAIELTNVINSQITNNIITAPLTLTSDTPDAGVGIEIAVRNRGAGITAGTNISVSGNQITGAFPTGSRAGINILARSYATATAPGILDGVTIENNTITGSNTRGISISSEQRLDDETKSVISNLTIEGNTITENDTGLYFGFVAGNSGADGTYDSTITIEKNNISNNTNLGLENAVSPAISFVAIDNYWGTAVKKEIKKIIDKRVTFEPYYLDATMTASSSGADTIFVDDDYTKDNAGGHIYDYNAFSKIQDAIDISTAGMKIIVAPGIYNERIVINKPLTLRGATYNINKNGYTVPENYAWNTSIESVINSPLPALSDSNVVDIVSDDVVFEGFVVQSLNALAGSSNDHLLRINATTGTANDGDKTDDTLDNIKIKNNVIGPNTNIVSQNGTNGRMGLYFASPNYSSDERGITNTIVTGNKIFDCKGNGNNIFIWGAAENYASPSKANYSGTEIKGNEIYGSHRSGIEISGGIYGLEIKNNEIYNNNGLDTDDPENIKYGNGIVIIRMGSDKTSLTGMGSENILIQNNEIYNNEKNGIYLGPINSNHKITNNNIHNNGWNAVRLDLEENYHPGSADVYDKTSDISINNNNLLNNKGEVMVLGTPTNGFIFDATKNWWGSADGPTKKEVSENVNFDPYYTTSGKTTLSDDTETDASYGSSTTGQADLPDGTTSIELSNSTNLDVSGGVSNSSDGNINVGGVDLSLNNFTSGNLTGINLTNSQNVGGKPVIVDKAVVLQSGTDSQPFTLTNSDLSNITVIIPDATTVLAPSGWDGKITPPKTGGSNSGDAPSGFSVGNTVIEVGSPNNVLLFDKPVEIVLTGVTGKVGYRPAGSTTWVQISELCSGTYETPGAPTFPGECYISNGTDTKIYTYHFTSFAPLYVAISGGGGGSYTPTVTSKLSQAAQKIDTNKDDKIDISDFNALMSNWGKTGTGNVADFNSDGKVDIFDFNLLMINWTK